MEYVQKINFNFKLISYIFVEEGSYNYVQEPTQKWSNFGELEVCFSV